MPTIRIPNALRYYVNGAQVVSAQGQTAGEAVESLFTQFPDLRPQLTNERGELRTFVRLFLGKVPLQDLQGLDTNLGEEDELRLVASMAGG